MWAVEGWQQVVGSERSPRRVRVPRCPTKMDPGLGEEPLERAQGKSIFGAVMPQRGPLLQWGVGCVFQAALSSQEGDILVGADRLYVQPVRRQHRQLVPHWGGAQPHLIHRLAPMAPMVPGVIQGTALGRGRVGLPSRIPMGEGPALSDAQGLCKIPHSDEAIFFRI